ncbi:Gfo/Idh/MocA family protein [Cerasicoccus maritimus]|uniref:Gfo/Idh/MocA family protein n=1 Tax=Cerasicoccus maritimus TaxID=490089 RepID=UPI002852BF55|nr:Gfo/Idh/MocA family oxidoreductase [Cerasicoccus maritimus]
MSHSISDSPIRFALIGCGSIAKTQIKALLAIPSEVKLVCLCDTQEERAQALAEEFGLEVASFESICADSSIEAVTFCTPTGVHASLAIRALEAGKHVIVEKPMDVSLEACQRLMEAVDESGKLCSVISQHRFDPASGIVREALDAGKLGQLLYTEVRIPWYRTQEYYDSEDWRGTWAIDGGGALTNQGIHTVDLMLWFVGPVKRVYARMATVAHERIEVEDLITVQVEFESGAMGSLLASTAMYPGYPVSLGLYGSAGSALIEGDELKTLAIQGSDTVGGAGANAHALQVATGGTRSASAEADKPSDDKWQWGDAHREQFRDFVSCIRSGNAPVVTAQDGLSAVSFIKACYQSAQTDAWVSL